MDEEKEPSKETSHETQAPHLEGLLRSGPLEKSTKYLLGLGQEKEEEEERGTAPTSIPLTKRNRSKKEG